MTTQQQREANALIKAECANFMEGVCIPLDCKCPQRHSESLLCNWFRDAVLPLDKRMHAQIMGGDGLKPCAECGGMFYALSNRAVYCRACGVKVRKKSEANRQRERRAKSRVDRTHLGVEEAL